MADFNAIVNGMQTTCAASGANNDITSLGALSTPLTPTQGGTFAFLGSTSTGSANAQLVTVTTPATGFSLTLGYKVSFTVGVSNTQATTLNISGRGALNVQRHTTQGLHSFVGGEFVSGFRVTVEYNGTFWELVDNRPVPIGSALDFPLGGCPAGTVAATSQAISRSTWTALFALIGTNYGAGDGSTTFNVPDYLGRALYGQDVNVGGLANRITGAGGNFDGTVVSAAGGSQNSNGVGSHNHGIPDPGHIHTEQTTNGVAGATTRVGTTAANQAGDAASNSVTVSATTGISVNTTGGSYTVLGPAIITNKCIQG